MEMYAGFGKNVYTAFATIGGNAVGVVATGKELCHNCVAKASRFVRLCDAFSVPVFVEQDARAGARAQFLLNPEPRGCPSGCYLCRRYHRQGGSHRR